MDIVISFDTEDFLTPEAHDAQKWWADALADRGLRGCFQCVGEVIRSWKKNNRYDIIEAIGNHEVGNHTDFHSVPPTHPEAVSNLSLSDGVELITKIESSSFFEIEKTFGRIPVSYCSPGDSWTAATLISMARRGVKVFCNDKLHGFQSSPYWYCGLLVAQYNFDFQDYYENEKYSDGKFEDALEKLIEVTPDDGVIVLYTHPTRMVTSAFWDACFSGGKRLELSQCPPAPLRSKTDISLIQNRCNLFLDYIANHKSLRNIDFSTLYSERSRSKKSLDDLMAEAGLSPGEEGKLNSHLSDFESYLPDSALDDFAYDWVPYSDGFKGRNLLVQAKELAWTSAPAKLNSTSLICNN